VAGNRSLIWIRSGQQKAEDAENIDEIPIFCKNYKGAVRKY